MSILFYAVKASGKVIKNLCGFLSPYPRLVSADEAAFVERTA